ncbi:histidine kinase N-terminal 7TM domain-containing diguanylate cyclase [Deinococcus arcticus]|uniref:PAS domain S-box/diguanylate cyclase (GGDEF) domain-containing protein n=1 Tax=Deinococcus arcticus TaxID=2136176 RepID=A0A2T3WBQ8_9DEIO|nr:histidine kinase N-terminal 7TM domain-containing protein [Deinococcus arcticus]PTA69338.1 PAS domain S-box/diguanylate cyclase (GGDEF) domain-containing protein [Deinococcus arcticus]
MTQYTLTPDLLPTLLALAVTLLMAGNTLQRTTYALQRAFLGVLLATCVWLGADVLSLSASDAQARWDWGLAQFLGILTIPVAWLALVGRHLRPVPEPMPWPRLLALLAAPLLTLVLIGTNSAHQLIWQYPAGTVPAWGQVERTPLYWLLIVIYPNALLVWGAGQLLPAWRAGRGAERHQITLLLLAAVVPTVANTAYLLGVPVLPGGATPAPVFFALCLVPVAWGMMRYGLLRVAPLAHRQVVEQLADAVFVLDARGRILEVNERAARLAGRPAPALRGVQMGDVFQSWPQVAEDRPVEWRPGREVWELRLSTVRNARGNALGQAVVARDVTERAQEHARVQRLASEDTLTGLGNRRAFETDLARETARAGRHGLPLAVAMIDLDGLKGVNDRHGHAAGDALLSAFGRALPGAFRPEDRAYRLGGDEFALLLTHSAAGGEGAIHDRLGRIVQAVRAQGFPDIGASVGVAYFPHEGAGAALVNLADERMYVQKAQHRAARSRTKDQVP